jgi:hypothetical protein
MRLNGLIKLVQWLGDAWFSGRISRVYSSTNFEINAFCRVLSGWMPHSASRKMNKGAGYAGSIWCQHGVTLLFEDNAPWLRTIIHFQAETAG